jgi:dienelactone hydrolase
MTCSTKCRTAIRFLLLGAVSILLVLVGGSVGAKEQRAVDHESIETILDGIDSWVEADTTRILAFIEERNALTEERITSSPYWDSTVQELSDILGIDYVGSPDIDLTGRIYIQMRITGEEPSLFYLDGPWGWPTQITPNGWSEKGLQIGNYRLDSAGDYLYQMVMKNGDENWDIYRFERDGSYRVLLEDRAISYGTPHIVDDDTFYFSIDNTEQIWFARYHVATGVVDTVYTESGAFYLLDQLDDRLLGVRFLSFSESQLIEVDGNTGEARELTDVGLYWSGDYTKDGRVVTLTDARSDEDEFMKLAVFDPAEAVVSPKKMRILYDPGVEIDNGYFNRESGTGVAVLNRDGYSEIVKLDMDGNATPVTSPGVGITGELGLNDRGDMAFGFNSPSTAPTVYYVGADDGALEQVGQVATFGFDFSKVNVSVVRYPSTDGTMIPALMYLPEGATRTGDIPCVVEYHGGPPGQSRPYFQRNIAFALSKGLMFLYPNVRGSTGYGPAWERADNLEGRFQALADAEAALDYVFAEGWTSPAKTAIWGASYGGYTVNYLAAHAPEKFACIVSDVGVADVDWDTEKGDQTFREGWEKEMGPVGSDLTRRLSPIFDAERIARPMLITAGYNDPRVVPSGVRRFMYVLENLGKEAYYYENVEAGHGASRKSDAVRDLARTYTFTFDHVLK